MSHDLRVKITCACLWSFFVLLFCLVLYLQCGPFVVWCVFESEFICDLYFLYWFEWKNTEKLLLLNIYGSVLWFDFVWWCECEVWAGWWEKWRTFWTNLAQNLLWNGFFVPFCVSSDFIELSVQECSFNLFYLERQVLILRPLRRSIWQCC